jgi:hypothetical protein
MLEVEHRKPADIATEFGCSTTAIHAMLGRLRRDVGREPRDASPTQPPLALDEAPPTDDRPLVASHHDDEALADVAGQPATVVADPPEERRNEEPGNEEWRNVLAFESGPAPAPAEAATDRSLIASRTPPMLRAAAIRPSQRSAPVGAKLAKPGFGLMMRTADGEENLTPFRSLDDLLSAIKPILRACANSPEPVWFSLQPVDLTTIDVEAA